MILWHGYTFPFKDVPSAIKFMEQMEKDMAYCPSCGAPAGIGGTCGSLACLLGRKLSNNNSSETPQSESYLHRLKHKQAALISEIHSKQREVATLTALIQFLTERPEVQEVAEKVMEV
jgi:hypothetical protein